jgi:tripartite-type tricarboxylate transporter receptor subunit TctC
MFENRRDIAVVTVRQLARALIAVLVLVVPSSIRAEQAYPTQPVTIVVPYAPGGITDTLARIVAERLGPRLGVPIVIDNRSGAGGVIGAQAVARSQPDGHTLLMHSTGILVVAANTKELRFDPIKELEPVAFVAGLPSVLVVHPSVPATTVAELLTYLRANPDRLNCGILGEGGGDHQACLTLERAAQSRMEHVVYRGLPPLDLDLVAGVIQVNVGAAAVQMPLVRDGKLRVLATATPQRLPSLPDLPTLIESGAAYESLPSNALFAPTGTPAEIIARLNGEMAAIMADAAIQRRVEKLGTLPGPPDVAALRALFQREWDRARDTLKH